MSAPRSPTGLNTSRNRALDIGTAKDGFPADLPYDPAAGAPTSLPGGSYADNVSGSIPPADRAVPDPKPFK